MMWFFLALYFAFWTSISTLITKRLTKGLHPATILLVGNLFVIPFALVVVLLLGIPSISGAFLPLLSASSILDVVAFFASIWAIKIAPISLISPISSFNPVFTALIAMLTLGEFPTVMGFLGIILIVIGAYLLNIADVRQSLFAPIKNLATNRGVQLSFLAYFLWAITPTFQKKAIFETTPNMPLFTSFIGLLLVTIFSLPFTLPKTVREISSVRKSIGWFLIFPPFATLAFWAAFTAFSQANVGYATAVFKLSVLFTIVFGALFFREERIKERLLGGGVMLLGTVLLVV